MCLTGSAEGELFTLVTGCRLRVWGRVGSWEPVVKTKLDFMGDLGF